MNYNSLGYRIWYRQFQMILLSIRNLVRKVVVAPEEILAKRMCISVLLCIMDSNSYVYLYV